MKNLQKLIFYFIVSFCFPAFPAAQIFSFAIESVNQINLESPVYLPKTNFAEIRVNYVNPFPDKVLFFNMLYLAGSGTGDLYWSVQNLALPPDPDFGSVSTWFDLDPLAIFPAGSTFEFALLFPLVTADPLSEKPLPDFPFEALIGQQTYLTGDNGIPVNAHLPPTLSLMPFLTWPPPVPPVEFKHRADMPNIDLDSTAHPPQPGYAGDYNACVPAATANSFTWLRKQEHVVDSLLTEDYGMGEDSLRKMLMEFSGQMMRQNNEGVFLPEMLKGKLGFIDKYKLPVRVKYQAIASVAPMDTVFSPNPAYGHFADNQTTPDTAGQNTESVSRAWLLQELCDGEDVEMQYHCCWFLNGVHQPQFCYAHSVVLNGMVKVGGRYGVSWNDDSDQVNPGGLRNNFGSQIWVNSQGGKDYLILDALSDTIRINADSVYTQRCFVESAVSESYDPGVTFVPSSVYDPASSGRHPSRVFPNPLVSGQDLFCQIELETDHPVSFRLHSVDGAIWFTLEFEPDHSGLHSFILPGKGLPQGIYALIVEQAGRTETLKLTVVWP
ncbi:MAG: hypothetical protein WA004_03340 [Saprospiraceae bacterium]